MQKLRIVILALSVLTYVQPSLAATCWHRQEGVEFLVRDNPLRGRLKIEYVQPGLPAIRADVVLTANNSQLQSGVDGFEIQSADESNLQVFRIQGSAKRTQDGYSGRIRFYVKNSDGEFAVEDAVLTCR